jgi:hypothetical protein
MSKYNIPNKGEIMINPKTQRPVRVGSRTWLGLVKLGLIEGRYNDPKELKESYVQESVHDDIQEINKTLPRNQHAVRGRGRYSNKIVSRNKKPDTVEMGKYTAKMASKVLNDNLEHISQSENQEEELERLILQEMAGLNVNSTKIGKTQSSQPRGRPPAKLKQQFKLEEPHQFQEEEEDEEDEEEEEEEDDIDYFENDPNYD